MQTIKTYRIETSRLVLRCYAPNDAQLLLISVNESIEHLKPWLPWVKSEPETLEDKVAQIRRFRSMFDSDQDHTFGIFDKTEQTLIGSTGLHNRVGSNAREIGYWINVNHIHKGFATEAAAALTKIAFEIENLNRLEIHCDSLNQFSYGVAQKLGFIHEATLKERFLDDQEQPRNKMIWTMFRQDYLKSPIRETQVSAWDILGNAIPIQ